MGKGKGEFRKEETFLVNACNLLCFFLSKYEYELLKQLLRNVEQNLIRQKCDHSHTHSDSDLPVVRGYDRLEKTNTTNDREL